MAFYRIANDERLDLGRPICNYMDQLLVTALRFANRRFTFV